MAATGEGVFLYNTLTPLGEESLEDGEDEYISLNGSFLPLESAGSPRGEDSVAEQATLTVTVERQETKFSRNVYQKTEGSTQGTSLQSLIDLESELLVEDSTPEFKVRPVPPASAALGVISTVNTFSVSRTNIQSVGSAQVEQDVEESEFISLNVVDENIESVVQETLEFKGKRVEAPEDFNTPLKEVPPWARGRDAWIQSPLLQLHQEIVDFCEFVAPTDEEQEMRDTAVMRVSAVVKSIWPSCQVKVFGSFATGLYLPTSDVDVVVLESGCQALQDGLKALAKALTRGHVGKSIQVIGKARVPIIKFVETTSNIPFDISFDVANGPEAADFIKRAMSAIPPLRPLCLVLKIFLQQRELNEVYQGGIGSYALLVMLLTHLQMHPSKRRASSRSQGPPLETNLGILLVDFLDLYGRTLNMKDVGVSCRGGGRFFPKRDRRFNDHKRPFLLCVEDPQSPDNDIGKNSYAIQKVRSAFMMAHRLLTNLNGDNEAGLLSRIVRMDAKLVERKVPSSLPLKSQSVPAKRPHPVTFAGYYHEPKPDAGEDKYVVGDGTFSNSDSDNAPDFKAPDRRRRGRWQDYEEEDFPRGESADGYLSKKAKRAKRYKEGVHDKDPCSTPPLANDRYNDGSSTPQDTGRGYSRKRHRGEGLGSHQGPRGKDTPKNKKSTVNATESSGPEEGEVRLGRRARKREDFTRWKAGKTEKAERIAREKLEREGKSLSDDMRNSEETVKGAKSVTRGNGHNRHTKWNEDDVESSRRAERIAREKLEREGKSLSDDMRNSEETVKGAKSVTRGNGHNRHTKWNEDDVESSRSSRKHSRFKETPAGGRGKDSTEGLRVEVSESTRRIVVTKPAHKKIKYV